MRVLITGAAGYVGSVLLEAVQTLPDVTRIVGVDLKPCPDRLAGNAKIVWIQADVSSDDWQEAAREHSPDAIVHLAFQIRQLYGRKRKIQRRWNVEGARKVFAFALAEPSVRRLIHFSTVTAYGAYPDNAIVARFPESAPLRERDYLYGSHKREIEGLIEQACAAADRSMHVVVLRCASISGPYGRFALGRFGIVSTLTGLFPFLPCGRADFGRQYLHEDDAARIVCTLLTAGPRQGYEVYNASPDDYLAAPDLAAFLGKRTVVLPPALLRLLFTLCWHASRGRIPTPRGAWKFVTYPIAVDGSALTRAYGCGYQFTSAEALMSPAGRHLASGEAPTVMATGAALSLPGEPPSAVCET